MFTRGYLICAYPSWWYADASMNYPAEPHSEVWKRETARLTINIKPAEQIQHTTHNFTSKHVCTWICQVLTKCGFQLHFISTWYTSQNIYTYMHVHTSSYSNPPCCSFIYVWGHMRSTTTWQVNITCVFCCSPFLHVIFTVVETVLKHSHEYHIELSNDIFPWMVCLESQVYETS